jgi:AcrR family transcriptional regulator
MTFTIAEGKPLKKKSIRDPEATRDALLAAGSELFAAHGYHGTSVETIADRARVNKAMISYHFGGKRGLLKAILVSTFDEVGTAVRALAATGKPAPVQLSGFIDLVTELATRTRRPAFPALFMRQALSAERVDREVLTRVGVVVLTLMEVIARGVQEGTLRPIDPFCGYWTLMAPLTLFLATEPMRRRAQAEGLLPVAFPTPQAFAQELKRTVVRGMCTDGHKEKV